MKNAFLRLTVGAVMVGALGAAQSATLSLTGVPSSAINVTANTNIANGTHATKAFAFNGTLSNAGVFNTAVDAFYTYCVELTEFVSLPLPPTSYTIVSGSTYFTGRNESPATIVDRLGRLFSVLGGANQPTAALASSLGIVATASQISAAIQLAVWESVYEDNDPGALDVTSGSPTGFWVSGLADSTAATVANTLLSKAAAWSGPSLYSILVLKNAGVQDYVLLQRVPEPSSLALAGLALAGLITVARRRRY